MGSRGLLRFLRKLLFSRRKLIPRPPRVRIASLRHVQFVQQNGERYEIANISLSGIGFVAASIRDRLEIHHVFAGVLELDGNTFPLNLRVVHVSPSIIGCSIEQPSQSLLECMNKQLQIELSGMNTRAVNSEILKSASEGKPHWFHGHSTELYYVENQGSLLHFHGMIWGLYFESSAPGERRFGFIKQEAVSQGIRGYAASDLIHYETFATPHLVDPALRFIENVPGLDNQIRQEMINRLKKYW